MKEAFFILLVIAVLLALTAIRYRRQIAAMLHIWRSLKSMRDQVKERRVPPQENIPAGPLVNCAKCRSWVPEREAIQLRGGTFYCSSACLESAVPAG
ncbi:MAG TPA: hypothetical protein VMZ26_18290 [Pyrinomonadaceae bacterium]|nr:hypothetical protein [Pyrinomonadaceae bacterium]